MRIILTGAVLATALLASPTTVEAKGPGKPGHGVVHKPAHVSHYKPHYTPAYRPDYRPVYQHHHKVVQNYHGSYGKKFSHGYAYHGKTHRHWTHRTYWSRHNCYCYWCPSTTCWYYWCQPRGCYYPVSYVAEAPPNGGDETMFTPPEIE